MSWEALVRVIVEVAGEAEGEHLVALLRAELGGARVYVPARRRVTRQEVEEAAPGRPREAARRLGVHPSTVYRALRRLRVVR